MSRFTTDGARKFLDAAGVFHDVDEPDVPPQTLNLNDVWGWAFADFYTVPDDQLVECAELAWRYGWAGILYFVSSKQNWLRSEFHDNNRMISFVRHEEDLRKSCKSSSELAYKKVQYTLGEAP